MFRLLAARYHPDNPQTGNVEKFLLLREALKVLADPEQRAAYDIQRDAFKTKPLSVFSLRDFAIGVDGESNRRLGVLCLLYKHRRSVPENPGLSLLDLEAVMAIPREHLMFTLWYLREKGLDTVLEHARDFIQRRLAPAEPVNDGRQTPMRNHPVFIAQHATATCCRGCLAKWHRIPQGQPLTLEQIDYIVGVLARWLEK